MSPRMDFHLVSHGEYLWSFNYKNAFIYFNRDFYVLGEHSELLQHFDDTCQIFCHFLPTVFIESQPVWTIIILLILCLPMQTCKQFFHETLNSKFSKDISETTRTSNSVYNFHMFLSLPTNDTAYKIWLSCPLYTDKFCDFLWYIYIYMIYM